MSLTSEQKIPLLENVLVDPWTGHSSWTHSWVQGSLASSGEVDCKDINMAFRFGFVIATLFTFNQNNTLQSQFSISSDDVHTYICVFNQILTLVLVLFGVSVDI